MSEEKPARVDVELEKDYVFRVDFGLEGVSPLFMDEPLPVGRGSGPNAERVLAAAVGNCLSASLLFCLRKSRVEVAGLKTSVSAITARNERGRLRVKELDVEMEPAVGEENRRQLERCQEIFEDFCIVTSSIRQGIPVNVKVKLR